jgi:NAD(P)H-hydrate epimerase
MAVPHAARQQSVVFDALSGSGLQRPVRPPFDRIIETINASAVRVFAVDGSSGLDCDTGLPMGSTVRACHTATVAAMQVGFQNPAAQQWLGEVSVIDMGAPRRLMAAP